MPGLDFLNRFLSELDPRRVRDAVLDKLGRPLHEQLFIKAHTGGVRGDGTVRELPARTLSAVKAAVEGDTYLRKSPDSVVDPALMQRGIDPKKDPGRSRFGEVGLYQSDEPGARYGLGTVGVYFDKAGNALIKDRWKVDNPEERHGDLIVDLIEGGKAATMIHDAARALGLYKEIPIEVRVPRSEWEAIRPEF